MPSKETDRHLAQVYAAGDAKTVRAAYEAWADSYDRDVSIVGYRNPSVVAALVARHVPDVDAPILDAGAGTGLLGELLAVLDYQQVTAIDISMQMLERARSRGYYRELHQATLGEALPFEDDTFAAVVSSGVFTPGHAPPSSFDELLRVTRPGGRLLFTVSMPALDQGFRARMDELRIEGRWRRLEGTMPFHPTPGSATESTFQAQGFVYEALR